MTTVEQIIADSIKEYKLGQSKARRREKYKLLDFYSGTGINRYIEPYFDADAFREIPVIVQTLQKDLLIRCQGYITLVLIEM